VNTPISIASPHKDDYSHVESILDTFPRRWAFGFARKYQQIIKAEGRQAANLYLIDRRDNIKPHHIGLASDDDEIVNTAKIKARFYFERLNGVVDFELNGIKNRLEADHDFKAIFDDISSELVIQGIKPPTEKKDCDYQALCRRFACEKWWRKALRVSIGRHVEHEAIKAGFVGFRSAYVSNETLSRRQQQIRRNNQMLEWIEAESDSGDKTTLAELASRGVSNPENRKNELMVRIRGVEEEAVRKGMMCDFLTITCPSRFHPTKYLKKQNKRISNKKYDGSTPKQAQEYLVNVWARIRAEFGRNGISPVGFRVAEPHKDGCPHWHLMLFVEKKHVDLMWRIVRRYACKEDAHELKSVQAFGGRFDRVVINPNEGSAAGYIAKYIAKNINMSGMDDFENHEGGSAADGLQRSVAWAAVWGIRQFQQIGGERITIWRELRRIRNDEGLPEVVAVLWRAANAGEYGHFIREAVKLKIALIRESEQEKPLYGVDGMYQAPNDAGVFDVLVMGETGRLVTGFVNRYGEQVLGAIKGLLVNGVELVTRLNSWVFSYKTEAGEKVVFSSSHKLVEQIETGAKAFKPDAKVRAFNSWLWDFCNPIRGTVDNPTMSGYPRRSRFSFSLSTRQRAPWTCVNNYTEYQQ